MEHNKIKMIAGPFAGYEYEKYTGEQKIICSPNYCVSVELIPGDYYRGITEIGQRMTRGPGTMTQDYLKNNPNMWTKA